MQARNRQKSRVGRRSRIPYRPIALMCILAVGSVLFVAAASYGAGPVPEGQVVVEVDELLTTKWSQHDDYKRFTPANPTTGEHERLGCLSVAIAQIMFYHRIQPSGKQTYDCCRVDTSTQPCCANATPSDLSYQISEDFNHVFRWDRIHPDFSAKDPGTKMPDEDEINETALYCYYAAAIVRKNFGYNDCAYIDAKLKQIRPEIAEHYSCRISEKIEGAVLPGDVILNRTNVETLIERELRHARPVLFFTDNHWMPIDGFGRTKAGEFCVHINLGWGEGGGWFAFWDKIESGSWASDEKREVYSITRLPPSLLEIDPDLIRVFWEIPWLEVALQDFLDVYLSWLREVCGEARVSHALRWARDAQDFADLLVGFVMEGTGPGGSVVTIDGVGVGEAVTWYAHDPYPEPDPMPVCVKGQDLCISFTLKSAISGESLVDKTANLLLTQVEPDGIPAILSWEMIPYSATAEPYHMCLDTSDLDPGIYDIYLGTSRDGTSRRIRIEVVEIQTTLGVAPLLTTEWAQGGDFMRHAEEMLETSKTALGCWSTAYAQIFYYHGLSPHGTQTYTCTSNDQPEDEVEHKVEVKHEISIDFDSYSFGLDFFDGTSSTMADDIAEYCFLTAVAIRKNLFGTGYVWRIEPPFRGTSDTVADAVEDYYAVDTLHTSHEVLASRDSPLAQFLITSELHEGRPLWLYVQSADDNDGHAMVIDGYRYVGESFEVHLNMGWGPGDDNDWYPFSDGKPILQQHDDGQRFWLVTVRPVTRPGSVTTRPAESP